MRATPIGERLTIPPEGGKTTTGDARDPNWRWVGVAHGSQWRACRTCETTP